MSQSNTFIKVTGTAVEAGAAASGGVFAYAVTKQWLDLGAVAAGIMLSFVMITYWAVKVYFTVVATKAEKNRQKKIDEIANYVLSSKLDPDVGLKLLHDMGDKIED